jgi:competence protein ComEA
MHRTFWLSTLTLLCLAVGVWTRSQWPSSAPALDCPLKKVCMRTSGGAPVVFCGEAVADSRPAQGGVLLTVGGKLNLNRASADELTLVPGVGPVLAKTLIRARGESGAFRTWDEVSSVRGVGPTKLRSLQRWTELTGREPDASD